MSGWVTQREAAELLGVHVSAVPKMVRRGDLAPRAGRPSLSADQVLELAAAREKAAADRVRRRITTKRSGPRPPDGEHVWLLGPAAAAVLGCSTVAIAARARRGRMPSALSDNRRWYRLDLLELQVRAEVARTRRQVSR